MVCVLWYIFCAFNMSTTTAAPASIPHTAAQQLANGKTKEKTLTQTHSEKKEEELNWMEHKKCENEQKKKVALDSTVPVSRCTSVPLLLYIAHRYFVFYMCSKCWIRIFKSNRKKIIHIVVIIINTYTHGSTFLFIFACQESTVTFHMATGR